MKTTVIISLLLSAGSLVGVARAQSTQPAVPTAVAPPPAPAATLVPNQTIYAPRLPGLNELTNVAAAQGLVVERIEQSASQITAVYRYPNGQTSTVAYVLLPGATGANAQIAAPVAPAPATAYGASPRVIYDYDNAPGYYNPGYYWYPPVSIGLGFGYRGGFRRW